ncbi:hypothetical protein BCR35DRAFT_353106 [Leucosporidium creatinivorum]|uniref:NAD-dependent epimerase/dehydratase domain-containing protein n=1 Tax=Leucosporidium creatinivorum TaxID=106004 RepID=A0A1Y2F123_9BASI|nr:hypothetical protein BCR35DRAFT_353106 [Leucosporidium creatinivorum]
MSSTSELVLITGATGFVGSEIALEALRQGFAIRLAVRKASQAEAFKAAYPEFASRTSFVVVPDLQAESAYDEAVKGVDYVVHAASPATFTPEDNRRDLLDPAIEGALSILKSANKVTSVTAVALTSSIVAHLNVQSPPGPEETLTDADWNPVTFEAAVAFPKEAGALTYAASKALAERAAWDFVKKEKPSFTLTTIAPTWVTGHNSEATLKSWSDLRSTHGMTAKSLYDVKEFPPAGLSSSFVDVGDVAKAHIGALKNPQAAGRRYLLVGGRFNYPEAAKAIAKAVPEAKSRFPSVEGAPFSPLFKVDSSAAERDFGFRYTTLEESMARFGQQLAALPLAA